MKLKLVLYEKSYYTREQNKKTLRDLTDNKLTSLGYDTIIILMFTRLTKNYYRNTNGMYCIIVFGFTYFC